MNWSDLQVIAAQAARADAGLVIGRPVVRDPSAGLFVIRNVDTEFPEPNLRLTDEEFQTAVASGSWVQLPTLNAERYCLTVAMSGPFKAALSDAPGSEQLPHFSWFDIDHLSIAYAHREIIAEWRSQAAEALLAHAEWRIGTAIASGHPIDSEGLKSDIRQAIFVTDERRDKRRMRVYIDLALIDRYQRETISASIYQLLHRDFGLRDWEVEEKLEQHARQVTNSIHRDELMPLVAFMPGAECILCTFP